LRVRIYLLHGVQSSTVASHATADDDKIVVELLVS
jgi:hypothetical protein